MFHVTTYPSTLALSVAEAKEHLNILDTSFDSIIEDYIMSAQLMLWKEANIWAAPATMTGYFQEWNDISINQFPFNTLVATYLDADDDTQTYATTDYKLFDKDVPIVFSPTEKPTLSDNVNPITLVITVGYTTAPDIVKQCLRMMVADMFEHRQSEEAGSFTNLSRNTDYQISLISRRTSI